MFDPCARCRRLRSLAEDERASARQMRVIEQHEAVCEPCRESAADTADAMAVLRSASVEASPDKSFESRVLRRWRVERRSRAISYWAPAVAGAVVAGAAILAVLQILLSLPVGDPADLAGREAQLNRDVLPDVPDYSETIDDDRAR
ncbi:MAG: hypothetical protein IH945_12580 [Armatimonadetes bacterium]|nr:hypothetical protein [Armatimonadota bacterium]